ncbi:hypothetical protein SKAU_G00043500 [Synaphobranchus kaupii]|uniref:Uncharacterized protein n=1 Tax=Synaphobranchus kaupii TaxID=118154 RepID=A0A9Q1J917_SYNKA|nr:hypothetical protein SKAU_G00043500 [Synaphobranchus kaupii]
MDAVRSEPGANLISVTFSCRSRDEAPDERTLSYPEDRLTKGLSKTYSRITVCKPQTTPPWVLHGSQHHGRPTNLTEGWRLCISVPEPHSTELHKPARTPT